MGPSDWIRARRVSARRAISASGANGTHATHLAVEADAVVEKTEKNLSWDEAAGNRAFPFVTAMEGFSPRRHAKARTRRCW